jgi:hypothetical protein
MVSQTLPKLTGGPESAATAKRGTQPLQVSVVIRRIS